MANLVQLANELEYVPKMQLAEMAQDPNNRFPQYLVLSEIQRRTLNERAYAAAQPQPTTTVAEEVVQDFVQPKGLQAGIPSESAPTDAFSSESMGMPASAPPIGMAEGGETVIDKWFGNEILNPFVSDTGTAKWYNPVAGLPHVQYNNLMETGEPMQGLPLDFSKDINEELGLYTPNFNLEEYEKKKLEELERLYAENPQAFLVDSSRKASGGLTGYLQGGQTTNPGFASLPPTKINQAMYGLEGMANKYANPYSGPIRSTLGAVGNMSIGDKVVDPNTLSFLNKANNTLDRVVSGTVGALVPGGSTPFRDMLKRKRARQSRGQESYDENVEALSRSDERSDKASGGLTGYANQGRTALPGVLPSLTPYAASEAEEYEEDANSLKESFKNSFLMDALVNYMMQQPAVSSSLDATMALNDIKKDVEESDYSGPTGAQIGGGLLALAGAIPHVRRLKPVGKWGKKIWDKAKKRYGAQPAGPPQTVPTGMGAPFTVGGQAYNPGQVIVSGTPKIGALRQTLLRTPEGRFISTMAPITAGGYLMSGYNPFSSETGENKEQTELTKEQKDYIKMLQEIELANAKASQEKPKKGLGGAFSPTDLIQLGGTIMAARNISELGQGIAGVAGIASERKTRAEEVEINKRLREAQISQLEAETSLLPDKQLAKEIEYITEAIKQAEEGTGDEETIAKLIQYRAYLIQQQALGRGYDPQAMSNTNKSLIDSYM